MSAIVFERRTQAYGNEQESVTRKTLGNFKAGQRVTLRTRHAQFYLNATTIPGAGNFVEGPYLRITPESSIKNIPDTLAACGVRQLKKSAFKGETLTGEGGNQALIQTYGEVYYEVDANNASILMPFDGTIDLVSASAGFWVFDMLVYQDPGGVNTRQSDLRLTRSIPANTTRDLYFPIGAQDYQFSGNLAGGFNCYVWQEDTGKLVLGYNTSILQNGIIVGTWYSTANGRGIRVQTANQTLCIFRVALP